MNRTLTSLIAMGVGAYAYHKAQERNLMSNRNMKKLRKRMTNLLP
ncbi:YrzQ family protein [Bacillus salitolerans]|uniref:YrzQ family protein n=1 Tax=Bacillus salitolerans TaxID=1437434 RepID=A0ABW4LPI3_9BACI